MRAIPLSLKEANAFVTLHHRHHRPVRFHLFSIGAQNKDNRLVGIVIVMRPVAQGRTFDGRMAEISRLATDGTKNVCSFLLARAARAAFAMGYYAIQTYTLPEEGGVSLRAAGWEFGALTEGKSWSTDRRKRSDAYPIGPKHRWWKVRHDIRARFLATPNGRQYASVLAEKERDDA
jgi:hypothetical protein